MPPACPGHGYDCCYNGGHTRSFPVAGGGEAAPAHRGEEEERNRVSSSEREAPPGKPAIFLGWFSFLAGFWGRGTIGTAPTNV